MEFWTSEANVRDRLLKDYELIFIAWCGGLGFVWTFIAFWVVTSWEPALPTPDLAGVIRAISLWPAWLTQLTGMFFYQTGISTYFLAAQHSALPSRRSRTVPSHEAVAL